MRSSTDHIVCYSGGHSSALVAVEVVRKFGPSYVTLLNHDIIARSESLDIKRFKSEVAAYLKIPITYANMKGWDQKDQFDVVVAEQAFKVGDGSALCTNRMKTRPFEDYLDEHANRNSVIYYGFDRNETLRIQRRASHIAHLGYRADFPLYSWHISERTIYEIETIGVKRPNTYCVFKHANCVGCLKAGRQHWYVVYCTRPDVWEKAKWAEYEIGYTIINGISLTELEPKFELMQRKGIVPTEHTSAAAFWAEVSYILETDSWVSSDDAKPCECVT